VASRAHRSSFLAPIESRRERVRKHEGD
jgi:hypothetical protein